MKIIIRSFHFIFLLLLFFAYSGIFAFPASTPRWIVVFLFSSLLQILYILSAKKNKSDFSFPLSIILIIIFYLWNLGTGFWAVDNIGFFESNLFLSFILLFFLSTFFFAKETKFFDSIFRFLVICLFFHSALGLFQYYGFDSIYQVAAPAGTFVNKNFATPLIPLLLPYLVYLIINANQKKLILFYAIVFVVTIIYLIVSVTRSSWLSVGIVSLVLSGYFFFSAQRKRLLIRFSPLLLIIIIFFSIDIHIKKSVSIHRDYREISSVVKPDIQLQQRLDKWKNGLIMAEEKLLFGWGAGNFDANYPLFHDAKVIDSGYTTRYFLGGIHNIFLQILIETGLVGFLLLSVFWIRLASLTILTYKRTKNPVLLMILLGLFGFLLDCFWNNTYQQPTFAIIVSLFAIFLIRESDAKNLFTFRLEKWILLAVHIPILLISVIIIFQFSAAETHLKNALYSESIGHPYTAWQEMSQAMEKWKWRSQNHFIASRIAYNYYLSSPSERTWQLVTRVNEQTLQTLPYHYMPNLISLLLEMDTTNPDFSKKNIDLFLAISPASKKGDSCEMIAGIYEKKGNVEKALSFYEKAAEYRPEERRFKVKIDSLKNEKSR